MANSDRSTWTPAPTASTRRPIGRSWPRYGHRNDPARGTDRGAWLDRAVLARARLEPEREARVLAAAGRAERRSGRISEAFRLLERAVELNRKLGQRRL